MKPVLKTIIILSALVGTPALAGSASPSPGSQGQTRDNISTAMHGEAFAFIKYSLYAEQARREGLKDVAALFEAAADKERNEHFKELAALYGLVGTTEANLRDAIAGERNEATTIYPGFAATAQAEGDQAAAKLFSELAKDEQTHATEFSSALSALQGH